MAKNKKVDIPHYEMLYIISNKYSENELKPIHEKIVKVIEDNNGKIIFTADWGKKRLAYPIDHFNFGYYTLLEFDVPGDNLKKINKVFRISKEILRYQIVARVVKTEAEIKKEKIGVKDRAVNAREDEKKKIELEKEKTRGKVDLKELDEKLDKILETDDLL